MAEIIKGRYRHYKGQEYRLLYEAKSSEDQSSFIVYQSLADDQIWVRRTEEFFSEVEKDGEKKPRFELLEENNDSWEDKYKRALADYQNLIKQQAKEKIDFIKYANESFLRDLLPVYDYLKLSVSSLKEEEAKNPWVEGVKHVIKQFEDVLSQNGVESIKTIGEKFDPESMEAVEGEGELVDLELRPGYKLSGKVIVPARVKVKNN